MISLYIKLFRSPPKGTDISLFGKVKDGFFVAPFGFVPFIIHHIELLETFFKQSNFSVHFCSI